jgi:ferredoxin
MTPVRRIYADSFLCLIRINPLNPRHPRSISYSKKMEEVDIKFEREDLSGIVAPGTYLYDAARRFGIEIECERTGATDACAMQILLGRELLSDLTKAEIEQLSDERRKNGERLACQAKIEKSGEVTIMTKEKVQEEKETAEEKKESFRKEFEELPLEKKIASLLELEAIAFGETISFVLNSPYMVFGKVMDVMAEFGLKFEKEAKEATRPEEHKSAETSEANGTAEAAKDDKTKETAKAAETVVDAEESVVDAEERTVDAMESAVDQADDRDETKKDDKKKTSEK